MKIVTSDDYCSRLASIQSLELVIESVTPSNSGDLTVTAYPQSESGLKDTKVFFYATVQDLIPSQEIVLALDSYKVPIRKQIGGFDYYDYMQKQGFCALGKVKDYQIVSLSAPNVFENAKRTIKDRISKNIRVLAGESGGALATSLVFGDLQGLSDDSIEEFKLTGATHLLAVSGANFSLALAVLETICRSLSKNLRIILIISTCLFYMFLIGFSNYSALRACGYLIAYKLLGHFGYDIPRANLFLYSQIPLVVLSPGMLWNTGYQLSVIAWGIINLFVSRLYLQEFIQSVLSSTLLAPISLFYFKQINLLGIIINSLLSVGFGILSICSYLLTVVCALFDIELIRNINSGPIPDIYLFVLDFVGIISKYQINIEFDSNEGKLVILTGLCTYSLFFYFKFRESLRKNVYKKFYC